MLSRLKFDISSIVSDIYSKIPQEVFESNVTTFVDVQAAGLQFIIPLVEILRKKGHSDDNIRSRVYAYVENDLYLNYVMFKYKDLPITYKIYDEKINMKFDVGLGNPPYQKTQVAKGKRGGGETLWDKFVIKTLNDVVKEGGYLCFIHPTLWRKPQSEKSSSREVNKLMMSKQIHYLEMHNTIDGMKTFEAGTRYDWYVMENTEIYKPTIINGEDRVNVEVDLRNYKFIPNFNLDFFNKLLPTNNNEETVGIIFNRTNYGTDKDWVIDTLDETHIYPLIHSTPKGGTRYKYSSRNDKGHFGIPKVIFGDSGIYDVIIDMNGEFGMTQHSMAIQVTNLEEAENIKKVLLSKKFTKFLETCMWSNFQIDWRLFSYLKKDFWKEFLDNDVNIIESNFEKEDVERV
jgi:hypothetical protein